MRHFFAVLSTFLALPICSTALTAESAIAFCALAAGENVHVEGHRVITPNDGPYIYDITAERRQLDLDGRTFDFARLNVSPDLSLPVLLHIDFENSKPDEGVTIVALYDESGRDFVDIEELSSGSLLTTNFQCNILRNELY